MLNSSLIEAFKTFTPQEMKEFGEFVTSPFFNKNVNVIKLFEIVKKYYPELDSSKLEKEAVYKKLFPSKAYKDSTIRLLMFYLYEVVEKFLAYNHFVQRRPAYAESLLNELLGRGLFKEFEKNIEKAYTEIEATPVKDESFYMNRFIFKNMQLSYISNYIDGKYEKHVRKEDMEFVSNNLTYYYLVRILKFYSVALNIMYLYNIKIETSIFETITTNFNVDSFGHVPLIGIYYNAIMILLKPEQEDHYFKLKKLVLDNEDAIDRESLSDLFINLENYCHRRIRIGKYEYCKEALEIYEHELEHEICFNQGYMHFSFYNSYVVNACRLEEHEKALEFIEKYRDTVFENTREAMYNYCIAFVEDSRGDYNKALEYLAKVKMEELYMKMDVRMLLCRIYYELQWHMPLQSLLDTFKKTVQNNKLMPDNRKQHFLTFIRFLNQLNNYKQKDDYSKIAELKDILDSTDFFPNKTWLERKTGDLLEKK